MFMYQGQQGFWSEAETRFSAYCVSNSSAHNMIFTRDIFIIELLLQIFKISLKLSFFLIHISKGVYHK